MTSTPQTLKRAGLSFGLALIATLALAAFAAAGSASAATHWAARSKVAEGTPTSIAGSATSTSIISFSLGGIGVVVECSEMPSAATAENPPGGGAGTLSNISLALKSCSFVRPNTAGCVVKNGEIPFHTLTGKASEKSGKSTINYSVEGSYFTEIVLEKCTLAGSYPVGGTLSARERSAGSGIYEFSGLEESQLEIAGHPVSLEGSFQLYTPLRAAFYSAAESGTQYWFAEGPTTLPEGTSTGFHSSSMYFHLSGTVAGTSLEISCAEGGNKLAGSLENPSGGGAGTASGAFTFSNCSLAPSTLASRCKVTGSGGESTFESNALSGIAGVSGATFSPTAGATLAKFGFAQVPGGKSCFLAGTLAPLEGSIVDSFGFGNAVLSGSALALSEHAATITGQLPLKTEEGKTVLVMP